MEKIISCCDYCNPEQSLSPYQGYGMAEMPEQDCIDYLECEYHDKGIMCNECQYWLRRY